MPFLSQRQIATELRAKAEKDYRKQLRAALLTPGLSAEQRKDIQTRLTRVGQTKVYDAGAPSLPGAIQLPSPPKLDLGVLQSLKKSEIQSLAEQHGVLTTGTKADIIGRLVAV